MTKSELSFIWLSLDSDASFTATVGSASAFLRTVLFQESCSRGTPSLLRARSRVSNMRSYHGRSWWLRRWVRTNPFLLHRGCTSKRRRTKQSKTNNEGPVFSRVLCLPSGLSISSHQTPGHLSLIEATVKIIPQLLKLWRLFTTDKVLGSFNITFRR